MVHVRITVAGLNNIANLTVRKYKGYIPVYDDN